MYWPGPNMLIHKTWQAYQHICFFIDLFFVFCLFVGINPEKLFSASCVGISEVGKRLSFFLSFLGFEDPT